MPQCEVVEVETKVVTKGFAQIHQLQSFLDRRFCSVLLMTSIVDYYTVFPMGLLLKTTWKLEPAVQAVTQAVVGVNQPTHVSPLLCKLY